MAVYVAINRFGIVHQAEKVLIALCLQVDWAIRYNNWKQDSLQLINHNILFRVYCGPIGNVSFTQKENCYCGTRMSINSNK